MWVSFRRLVSCGRAWLTVCPPNPLVWIVQHDVDWPVREAHCWQRLPTTHNLMTDVQEGTIYGYLSVKLCNFTACTQMAGLCAKLSSMEGRSRLKCDGTCAETRFRLSARNGPSPFK